MADPPDADGRPWLTLSEGAAKSGRHIGALRSLVRRGRISARKGNGGQWLIQLPDELQAEPDVATGSAIGGAMGELLAEVAELREALAEAKAEARSARDIAEARVDAAKAKAAAVRELADRLTAELVEARRPWWRKLIG